MRTLLVLAAFVAVMHALALPKKVYQSKMAKVPSLRSKMIREGTWSKVVAERRRVAQLSSGSQPFIDYYDDFYLSNITMGTPAQGPFQIVPDTGSSNLWLIDATKCTSQVCQGFPDSGYKKNRFDPTKSSSFQNDGQFFSIQYGSGSCYGTLGVDVLAFAGLQYATQKFGLAQSIAQVFGYQPIDGIMGLGWPALAVDNVVPPMQNLLPSLDAKLFTVWMDRVKQISMGGSGGLITYGALDMKNCDSTVNYVKLSSQTYWQFPIDGFAVGTYSDTKSSQVISDTGTSWLGGPGTAINAIVAQTGAQYDFMDDIYTVPCSKMSSLPDLTFTIGGMKYTIPSVEYVLDLELGNGNCALTMFDMDGAGFGPQWILGDTFIRSYCNIYDIGNAQIGFAKANHNGL